MKHRNLKFIMCDILGVCQLNSVPDLVRESTSA